MREAFNVSSYFGKSGFNEQAFAYELAKLAGETCLDKAIVERVSSSVWEQNGERVVNREFSDHDVEEHFSNITWLDKQERAAGLKIRESMLTQPDGSTCLWISPPGDHEGYSEGRIQVGFNFSEQGVKKIKLNIFPINFSATECIEIANSFGVEGYTFGDCEDIRSEVLVISNNGWEKIKEKIYLPEIWQAIESEVVNIVEKNLYADAWQVTREVAMGFDGQMLKSNHAQIALMAERHMRRRGHNMSSGPCGAMPSDLYEQGEGNDQYSLEVKRLDLNGKTLSVENEHGTFVWSCPQCKAMVRKVLKKGAKCPNSECKRVYVCG